MAQLSADRLVAHRGRRTVVDGVSLELHSGELIAVFGESGAGKTTLLRLLAGLERPAQGSIHFDPSWARRGAIGIVFQDLGLWSHHRAAQQVGWVLAAAGVPRRARAQQIASLLEAVGLSNRALAYPAELSGGEAQRLALARTLAAAPQLLLLDEPFAQLDRPTREQLFELVLDLHHTTRRITVFVTHDRQEALVADRMVVLRAGRVIQHAPPQQIHDHPADRHVAQLVGPASFLPARRVGRQLVCILGEMELAQPSPLLDGESGLAVIRRRQLRWAANENGQWLVQSIRYLGEDWVLRVHQGPYELEVLAPTPVAIGTRIQLAGCTPIAAVRD
jgi:ABC-type sulfate/molybdate transport systems ATPase subunit